MLGVHGRGAVGVEVGRHSDLLETGGGAEAFDVLNPVETVPMYPSLCLD